MEELPFNSSNSFKDPKMSASMKRLWLFNLIILAFVLILFISGGGSSSHILPLAYNPPDPPELTGILTPNTKLKNAQRLLDGKVLGPEDVIVDNSNTLYIANSDGRILKYQPGRELTTFFQSEGRPLGMRFDSKGNLIVCHTTLGLISIDAAGHSTILVPNSDDFHLIDDLVISSDDVVYFTNATNFEGLEGFYYDILLHRSLGSVWSYDLKSGKLEAVMWGLYFANGIQLSPDENYLLVNETAAYRVRKVWVRGLNRGMNAILLDNLPGFPDGLDKSADGNYWISLVSPRQSVLDKIYHPHPLVKKILMYLPIWLRPGPTRSGMILKISPAGEILSAFFDEKGEVIHSVTNVFERNQTLYIGSLLNDAVGVLSLPVAEN